MICVHVLRLHNWSTKSNELANLSSIMQRNLDQSNVSTMHFPTQPTHITQKSNNNKNEILSNFPIAFPTRGIQLSGHSAGAHLAFYMLDRLVERTMASLVKSMYLISGVYDLCELRFTSMANANNILSLDDQSSVQLSPLRYDFGKWAPLPLPSINVYIGEHDPPKLIEHSHHLNERLNVHRIAGARLFVMEHYDHFNIVEELAKPEYQITRTIIDDAKSF